MLGIALAIPLAGCMRRDEFSPSDADLIAEIAEIIIPTTNTIGARGAQVGDFVQMMVNDWFSEEERQRFMVGMRRFERSAIERYHRLFLSLSLEQRTNLVGVALEGAEGAAEGAARPVEGPNDGSPRADGSRAQAARPPFILLMKRLTVLGYYTSEAGATQELLLNLVPGSYEACGHRDGVTKEGLNLGLRNPTFSAS